MAVQAAGWREEASEAWNAAAEVFEVLLASTTPHPVLTELQAKFLGKQQVPSAIWLNQDSQGDACPWRIEHAAFFSCKNDSSSLLRCSASETLICLHPPTPGRQPAIPCPLQETGALPASP